MAQHQHGKAPVPMEMSHITNQISSLPVAPAADPQKREIVGKLNELASQMKVWAVQVEGFASLLNSFSMVPVQGPPPKPHSYPHPEPSPDNAHYHSRGAPNGQAGYPYPSPSQQQPQQYANSQQYQFHVQQYQGRHPDGASPHGYPPSQPQSQASPLMPTTSIIDGNEKSGKRRRKTDATRRKKDPLAPKRPPSAYILYQNDVRKQMQDKYPELPYSDVLGKISESWQTIDEGKKKVYLDMVERDKVRYEDEKLRYNMGQEVPTKPTPRRPLAALRAPSDPEINAEVEGEEAEEEMEGAYQDDLEPEAKRTRLVGATGTRADAPADPSSSYQQPQLPSQAAAPQQGTHTPDPSSHGYSHPHTPVQPAGQVVMLSQPPVQHPQPLAYSSQRSRHATPQTMFPLQPPSQTSQTSHPSTPASLAAHHSPQLSHGSPQVSPQLAHLQPPHPGHPMPHLTPGVVMSASNVGGMSDGETVHPIQAPSHQ